MTWISNAICPGLIFMFHELRRDVVIRCVDIDGTVDDLHCLNFLFKLNINMNTNLEVIESI
jgi:hypothetical protein